MQMSLLNNKNDSLIMFDSCETFFGTKRYSIEKYYIEASFIFCMVFCGLATGVKKHLSFLTGWLKFN